MADNPNLLSTPENYATPDQIKSTYDYAKALMSGSGQQSVHHWTQGVSNMVSALIGGNLDYNANKRERQRELYDAGNRVNLLGQSGAFGQPGQPQSGYQHTSDVGDGDGQTAFRNLGATPGEMKLVSIESGFKPN